MMPIEYSLSMILNRVLDIPIYIKAWEKCIEQYPILRTAFNWEEEVIQIIYKEGNLDYQIHDLSNIESQVHRNEAIDKIQKKIEPLLLI